LFDKSEDIEPNASDLTRPLWFLEGSSREPSLQAGGDIGPQPRLQPVYGRGEGWTDPRWRDFDRVQHTLADRVEAWARVLNDAATDVEAHRTSSQTVAVIRRVRGIFGLEHPSPAHLRQLSTALTNDVGALRGGLQDGYVASALSLRDLQARTAGNPDPISGATLMATPIGSKILWVNRDHRDFRDDERMTYGLAHDVNHAAPNSFQDERWPPNGQRAYSSASEAADAAYHALSRNDPLRALRSPDHIANFIGDPPPR
jgi:hypothetical protein